MSLVPWVLAEVVRQKKSMKKVATRAGYDKDSLYRWQHGAQPRIDAVEAVLDVLGYKLEALPSHTPLDLWE